LEEGELKNAILRRAQDVRFKMAGIFTIDGSKRSSHSNAYFAGMGRFRRIVLFDTIRDQMTEAEIIAVLAHEMGHNVKKHVQRQMILSFLFTLVGFWLLSVLLNWNSFFETFNAGPAAPYKAVVLFSLFSSHFTFFLTPLTNYLSRKHEFEADKFSVNTTGDRASMASSLTKLSKENLSNLTPHPWYSFYHYSHPTTLERVASINCR
jgi:STE24 endopeptidase